MRKNEKKSLINYENSISKSNELSMAKLNKGLTLNQMQLLAFSIFSTQKNGVTEFHKVEFEKKFGISKYKTEDAMVDAEAITSVKFSFSDLENNKFSYWNVFRGMSYDNGLFKFVWAEEMIPHILELKEKYITIDLTITSKFKSGFSWTLYDYLKAHYGYWHKLVSKDALMRLFGVEKKKTYQNTAQFKRGVLDVAIAEINKFTELEVHYKEIKEGRSIIGFDLIWSNGKALVSATKKQINELKIILDTVFEDVFRFTNLDNRDDRERAIQLVRQTEEMKLYIEEPISITKERANELIEQANWILKELQSLMQNEEKKKSMFYNWLEERESEEVK
ncbi:MULTISPECIES: replication initiation protein [Bacillales]|uniref:RepB family plasmid replication initiator protein n=1 Tax=Lysinibacillus halotolerans TaxID=1368476 RepID=A0A3M8H1Q4_9BACI|nr:replication initiation protein [Lysinibacillus halotolerans]RNC96199.1 RepB family plasmid replication initiator protein [Lysinibacillus halotolerans]